MTARRNKCNRFYYAKAYRYRSGYILAIKLSIKYRIATDMATIAGKYNDTPALNSSLNWAVGADAAEVKLL